MKSLLLAVQFLTSIPIKIKTVKDTDLARSVIYYPLVGLLLGCLLNGINYLLAFFNIENFLSSVILVILLIILTAGLHLDGLSDTMDAFLSRKSKFEMLEIMRDSHAGAMGVISIVSVILLEIALINTIGSSLKPIALFLMCILSRWAMVFLMFLFPYARLEGKAKIFMDGINLNKFILASLVTVLFAFLIWGLKGLGLFAIVILISGAFGKYINRKINGITGDTLGATNELIEVATLIAIYAIGRIIL